MFEERNCVFNAPYFFNKRQRIYESTIPNYNLNYDNFIITALASRKKVLVTCNNYNLFFVGIYWKDFW